MSHETAARVERALLVGVQLPGDSDRDLSDSLAELSRLAETLGLEIVGEISQKRPNLQGALVIGEGKLVEIARVTGGTGKVASVVRRKATRAEIRRADEEAAPDELDESSGAEAEDEPQAESTESFARANVAVFDCELTPSQTRNLESALGARVMDRTGVIIEIFSRHARTRAARLQVEIARLAYLAPRLRETGGGGDRGGGGVGGRGAGESSIELDRRKIRDRIKELKRELDAILEEQSARRERRARLARTAALVGYTNAGKSSLMRAMTGSDIYVADKLFATLETTVRPVHPAATPAILLSDTVGFIKKLPHDLVASFRSTLDEALNASLLIYVVDASDPAFPSQLQTTRETLAETGVGDAPSWLVLNKQDLLTDEDRERLARELPDAIFLSTRDPASVSALRERLIAHFDADLEEAVIRVRFDAKGAVGEVRARMRVIEESYDESGARLRVRAPKDALEQLLRKYPEGVKRD